MPPPAPRRSRLREDAPQIRTWEQLQRAAEQVYDATAHGALDPKQIDGLNTTLKMIRSLNYDIPLRMMSMVAKFVKGGSIPYPRAPMVLELLGLLAAPTKGLLSLNDFKSAT